MNFAVTGEHLDTCPKVKMLEHCSPAWTATREPITVLVTLDHLTFRREQHT